MFILMDKRFIFGVSVSVSCSYPVSVSMFLRSNEGSIQVYKMSIRKLKRLNDNVNLMQYSCDEGQAEFGKPNF